MLVEVQQNSLKWAGCAVAALALATAVAQANVDANPYATIVDRNPFALKPPPPPPPPPDTAPPPVPMAKVTLTGIVSSFGEPRALLEVIEDGGKAGAGTPKRPILREGERVGPVEVLSIDIVKNTVRLRNSGVETNVTFPEIAKSSGPVPGGPGMPGTPPTFTPPPQMNVPQPHNPQASAPTIISPNGAAPSSGVTLMGNNAATPTTTAGLPGALGTSTDGGMRTIPSRPLRTENAANPGNLPPMTKEQADLLMEVNRLRGGPPAPPTSLTPMFQDEQNGGNPNPRLPSYPRGAPPPVPGGR